MVLVANSPPDESKRPIHNNSVEMDNMDWDGLDGALKKVGGFFLTTYDHLNLRSVIYIPAFSFLGQHPWAKLQSWPSVAGQRKHKPM